MWFKILWTWTGVSLYSLYKANSLLIIIICSAISSVWSNPALPGFLCDINRPALLCCPPSDAPRSCLWRGENKLVCNASCDANEIMLATDPVGGAYPFQCLQGEQALCCKSNLNLPAFGCEFSGNYFIHTFPTLFDKTLQSAYHLQHALPRTMGNNT